MDSLTQIALGSCVSFAVLGKDLGPRRAIILGGVIGALPDFDVLISFKDPVEAFIQHRGWTHSIFVHAAITPLLSEAIFRFFAAVKVPRVKLYLGVYLCLATHALLDALTIYGTKLLWPFSIEPFGTGSIFIIDPLYTIPILATAIWALCLRSWSRLIHIAVMFGLLLSCGYQLWCLVAQTIITSQARTILNRANIIPKQILVTAMPFNSLLWRVIAIQEDSYINLYLPIFGSTIKPIAYLHSKRTAAASCLSGNNAFKKLAWFSHGFFRIDLKQNEFVFSDIRMGVTPNYIFKFIIAQRHKNGTREIFPQRVGSIKSSWNGKGDLDWLLQSLFHKQKIRPAEASALFDITKIHANKKSKTIKVDCTKSK